MRSNPIYFNEGGSGVGVIKLHLLNCSLSNHPFAANNGRYRDFPRSHIFILIVDILIVITES